MKLTREQLDEKLSHIETITRAQEAWDEAVQNAQVFMEDVAKMADELLANLPEESGDREPLSEFITAWNTTLDTDALETLEGLPDEV